MASGLGVVATDDDVRRNIIGNAGLFVEDPSDTESYARALKKGLKENFGSVPQEQAKRFSWDEVAKKYENALQALLLK